MNIQEYANKIKELQKEWNITKEEAKHYLEWIDIIND